MEEELKKKKENNAEVSSIDKDSSKSENEKDSNGVEQGTEEMPLNDLDAGVNEFIKELEEKNIMDENGNIRENIEDPEASSKEKKTKTGKGKGKNKNKVQEDTIEESDGLCIYSIRLPLTKEQSFKLKCLKLILNKPVSRYMHEIFLREIEDGYAKHKQEIMEYLSK